MLIIHRLWISHLSPHKKIFWQVLALLRLSQVKVRFIFTFHKYSNICSLVTPMTRMTIKLWNMDPEKLPKTYIKLEGWLLNYLQDHNWVITRCIPTNYLDLIDMPVEKMMTSTLFRNVSKFALWLLLWKLWWSNCVTWIQTHFLKCI